MNTFKCSKCGAELSDQSNKQLGFNDTYVIIFECNTCKKVGFTVTKNTTEINGAKVIKFFDKEIHSKEEIDNALKMYQS